VTIDRESTFKTSGVRVKPQHWNDAKKRVRKSDPLAASKNARLEAALVDVSERVTGVQTGAEARRAVRLAAESFTAFFQRHVDELKADGKHWEWSKYRTTLRKMTAALGGDVLAPMLDTEALRAFERHLRRETDNSPNTLRKELVRLRTVCRRALREGVLTADPFERYELPGKAAVSRRKLTLDEMNALAALELEAGTRAAWVRDAFLFSFYAAGMRFGDVATLRVSSLVREAERLRLAYRMMKTGTAIDLPLPPPAVQIAERYRADAQAGGYLFPILTERDGLGPDGQPDGVRLRRRISSRNASANTALKELAAKAGIRAPDEVSFHVARHSFADYARTASGNVYAVSKALGHANLTITETYLKSFDRDATDRLQDDLWGPP
jgi:integrase